jgi:hypothetical protein
MIYNTLSALYARFVRVFVRCPPDCAQFDIDGDNKLRPDVEDMTSRESALVWAVYVAKDHRTRLICLKHNSVMMSIDRAWKIYWIPLATGVKICNLIHPPANYEPDCYAKMQRFGIRLGDVYVQVQHGHVSHPLDSHRGDPCNHCGFPVPSLLRKRCGACRLACYCSIRCQEGDWTQHKGICREWIARAMARSEC